MTPILILEAFGQLPATDLIQSERERERRERESPPKGAVEVGILHRAFESRAELMGWSATSPRTPLPSPLWNMFEAGLTSDSVDASLIGWAYVGLANPIDLSRLLPEIPEGAGAGWATFRSPPSYKESTISLSTALPPLTQCLADALQRIGAADVSGFQLTCYGAHLQPRGRYRSHLIGGASWFDVLPRRDSASAFVAFDVGFTGSSSIADLMRRTRYTNDFPFSFDVEQDVPEQHKVRIPGSTPFPDTPLEPSNTGISVSLPEWSASAAGWVLATVIDAAHTIAPDAEDFAVRITRVR